MSVGVERQPVEDWRCVWLGVAIGSRVFVLTTPARHGEPRPRGPGSKAPGPAKSGSADPFHSVGGKRDMRSWETWSNSLSMGGGGGGGLFSRRSSRSTTAIPGGLLYGPWPGALGRGGGRRGGG